MAKSACVVKTRLTERLTAREGPYEWSNGTFAVRDPAEVAASREADTASKLRVATISV